MIALGVPSFLGKFELALRCHAPALPLFAMAWAGMLGRANSFKGIPVEVRRMTSGAFKLPIWTGPDTGNTAAVEPLQRGTEFIFCEVRESAHCDRICGRIDGVGWVNLAYCDAHRSGNPVWYVSRIAATNTLPDRTWQGTTCA